MKSFIPRQSEQGSIAPLGIGVFAISMALVLIITASASLFILQKRLTNIAESAALFVASGAGNTSDFLAAVEGAGLSSLRLQQSMLADNLTTSVRSCAIWKSPVILFVREFELCSHASARSE